MKVVVIGAGIIGGLTAYRLAQQGVHVTVIDAARPADGASGASFGWLNASFYLDHDHFRLRLAGIEAYRRLTERLPTRAVDWPGALVWEETGATFDAQYEALTDLGYAVHEVDRVTFARLEPNVDAPERALLFAQEGVVELPELTADALRAAADLGARVVAGVAVTAVDTTSGRVTGVRTQAGFLPADQVVVAAGTGTSGLLEGVGVRLPMLHRPGLILRTGPMPRVVHHILASPEQEVRQDASGCIIAPTAAHHQQDDGESAGDPVESADRAARHVSELIGQEVRWQQVTLALRPVPGDGLPVIGDCGPEGLYVTTMHSGATLAALVAELAAAEICGKPLGNGQAALLAPYRPQRFA